MNASCHREASHALNTGVPCPGSLLGLQSTGTGKTLGQPWWGNPSSGCTDALGPLAESSWVTRSPQGGSIQSQDVSQCCWCRTLYCRQRSLSRGCATNPLILLGEVVQLGGPERPHQVTHCHRLRLCGLLVSGTPSPALPCSRPVPQEGIASITASHSFQVGGAVFSSPTPHCHIFGQMQPAGLAPGAGPRHGAGTAAGPGAAGRRAASAAAAPGVGGGAWSSSFSPGSTEPRAEVRATPHKLQLPLTHAALARQLELGQRAAALCRPTHTEASGAGGARSGGGGQPGPPCVPCSRRRPAGSPAPASPSCAPCCSHERAF